MESDRPGALAIEISDDALPGYGELSVSFAAADFALKDLAGTLDYLVHYPNGCIEQTASSLLPLLALGTLAKRYPLGIPDVDEFAKAGVRRIGSMQQASGSFSYWPDGGGVSPHWSAYAAWVLGIAEEAGHDVPPGILADAYGYLDSVVSKSDSGDGDRDAELPLALYALAKAGHHHPKMLERLYERRATLPVFAAGFLTLAIHERDPSDRRLREMEKLLSSWLDNPREDAVAPYHQMLFDSPTRTLAIALFALLHIVPEHSGLDGYLERLLRQRENGHWRNTQENAYALLAIAKYGELQKPATAAAFEVRAWVNDEPLPAWTYDGSGGPVQPRLFCAPGCRSRIERRPQ